MNEELGPKLKKRLIVAVAMGVLFGLIIMISPWLMCESLIQVAGLLIVLVFLNKKQISAIGILKVFVGVSLVYSITSNYFIWILHPSSEVAKTIDLITFLFFNNSIFLLGVSISLFVFAYKFKTN